MDCPRWVGRWGRKMEVGKSGFAGLGGSKVLFPHFLSHLSSGNTETESTLVFIETGSTLLGINPPPLI